MLVRAGLLAGAILPFALWLASPALGFPWYYDDFHLVRAFSRSELHQAFTGPWDVDDLEFRSYRPFMTLFNHLRASGLGEDVWMHRVLGVALCALCVSIACLFMTELGLGIGPAIGAGLLVIAAASNTANLIWITDAAHALSAAFVLAGALVVLVPRFRWFHGLVLYAAALAGMLVREDIAVLFSLVALAALTTANRMEPLSPRNDGAALPSLRTLALSRLLVVIACLTAAIVTYFALQRAMVPRQGMSVEAAGGLVHFYWTLLPGGTDTVPIVLGQLAAFVAAVLGLPFIYRRNRTAFVVVVLLFAGVVLACLPGLLTQRMNLLLVPTLFYAFFLAACCQVLSARIAVRWGVAVVWAGCWRFASTSRASSRKRRIPSASTTSSTPSNSSMANTMSAGHAFPLSVSPRARGISHGSESRRWRTPRASPPCATKLSGKGYGHRRPACRSCPGCPSSTATAILPPASRGRRGTSSSPRASPAGPPPNDVAPSQASPHFFIA